MLWHNKKVSLLLRCITCFIIKKAGQMKSPQRTTPKTKEDLPSKKACADYK